MNQAFVRSARPVVLLTAAFVIVAACMPRAAAAQIQNSNQKKCILAMNSAAAKLAQAHSRQAAACIKDATNLVLPAASVNACIADTAGKLGSALAKTVAQESARCGTTPGFGYSGAATTNGVIVSQEIASIEDVFGDNLASAIVTAAVDAEGAACQAAVARRYGRVASAYLRAFLDCKKAGLSAGQITSIGGIEACLDTAASDPKGKIASAIEKLGGDFIRRCMPLGDPTAPFPGDCQNAPDFLTCIENHARCRVCLEVNGVDNADKDCERFDNGDFDATCVDPDANECAGENGGHNCNTNATCTDEEDGYSCECNDGYSGDGVVCTDINECTLNTDNCSTNATCTNTPGSFTCACNGGFTGDGVTCTDINECALNTDNCHLNATCTNTAGGFICTCNSGYSGNGVSCADVNECALNTDNCHANATCTNTPGSFTCACNAGFTGNGVTCTDLNECIGQGGGNNCHANAVCTNTPGSFSCACAPGYSGDGIASCVDVNECVLNTDNCSANATCTNTIGSFTCTCNAGYHGNGVTCTDDNECIGEGSGNNCSTNATCSNTPGSFTCACREGYYGDPYGSVCDPILVTLTSPAHGIFTQAASIGVTGNVTTSPLGDVSLTINGNPVTIQPNGTFSTTISLTPAIIFNEVRAVLTHTPTGFTTRDRRVVIVGPSINYGDGTNLPQSVGLRINDTGFNKLEPVLESLVDLDIGALLPAGTNLGLSQCFVSIFGGCIFSLDAVYIDNASLGGFGINVDSVTNSINGTITLNNIEVNLDVHTTLGQCDLRVRATTATINGNYFLEPDPFDAQVIDVNQNGNVSVGFSGFNHDFTGGFCNFPVIEPLINLILGDVQTQVRDALVDFLKDPDGGGPQDAVVAQAIEDALAAVELTGPIGDGFGINLDTPLFAIPEDVNGITLASGAIASTLNPAPGAPVFPKTLLVPSTYPTSQLATGITPGGLAYDMGLAISESAFNQILAAQAESGTLQGAITELELTPGNPTPLTAGLLALFLPEFGQLPPGLPLTLNISPTLAPVLTGSTGPLGELAELVVSHLLVDVTSGPVGMETLHARLAIDAAAAFDLTIEAGTGNLLPEITTPDPGDILITLLDNPLGLDEPTLQTVIPALMAPLFPQLAGAFGAFPLPEFLGLQPTAVEVSRIGATHFLGVYLSVVVAP